MRRACYVFALSFLHGQSLLKEALIEVELRQTRITLFGMALKAVHHEALEFAVCLPMQAN